MKRQLSSDMHHSFEDYFCRQQLREDKVVVVIADDCVVVDGLEEASFEVDQVLATGSHHVHEALHQTLDLLVVVELVGQDSGNGEHPGALLEGHRLFGPDAVAHEEAQREVDEEGLGRFVDALDGLQIHLKTRNFDRPDCPQRGLREEVIREELLAAFGTPLLHDENRYFFIVASGHPPLPGQLLLAYIFATHFRKTDSRTQLLERKGPLVGEVLLDWSQRGTQSSRQLLVVGWVLEELHEEGKSFLEELFFVFGREVHFLAVEGGDEWGIGVLLGRLVEAGQTLEVGALDAGATHGRNQTNQIISITISSF